jgi:hypothetical protein
MDILAPLKIKQYLIEIFPFFPGRENLVKVVLHFAPFKFVLFKEKIETKSIMPDLDVIK